MNTTTRCGIHGDDTTDGRCTVCDHLREWWANVEDDDVPAELVSNEQWTSGVPRFQVRQNGHASPWADLLDLLPTIDVGDGSDLKVDRDGVRVWLSRCTIEDGEPFARTIYVEALRGGRWMDMGYFDGDEDDPHPMGTLGDGWNATYRRLGVVIV